MAAKEQRLAVRLSGDIKRIVEQAAALEGRSVSDFAVAAAAKEARRTIRRHHELALTEGGRRRFFEILTGPGPELSDEFWSGVRAARARVSR